MLASEDPPRDEQTQPPVIKKIKVRRRVVVSVTSVYSAISFFMPELSLMTWIDSKYIYLACALEMITDR